MDNECSVREIQSEKRLPEDDPRSGNKSAREKRVQFKKKTHANLSIEDENMGTIDYEAERLRNENTQYNIFEKFEDETNKQLYLRTTHELEEVRDARGLKAQVRKVYLKLKGCCMRANDNLKIQIILNVVTIYILFADYFRVILFQRKADLGFDVATIICMLIFSLEMGMFVMANKNYFLSFYFFTDLVTTCFLVFDITLISNELFNFRNYDNGSLVIVRFGKIIRVVRLIRILRFFRRNGKRSVFGNFKKIANANPLSSSSGKESKVTKMLKESNIKKLIILIMVLLIGLQFLDAELYLSSEHYELDDKAYYSLYEYSLFGNESLINVKDDLSVFNVKLASFMVDDQVLYRMEKFNSIRVAESMNFIGDITMLETVYACQYYLSTRYEHVIQAVLDILKTLLIGVVLIFSIYNLNKDVSYLVLNPLERMIKKIKAVSIDPLKAIKSRNRYSDNRDEMNETLIIERAINKISELLVLGFGQAGSRMITHFLFDPDKDFDQVIPGEKMHAIFGFCNIRNFNDVTEVLLEDVMGFVNKIAEIVHTSVDKYGGAANKNMGDAFLLVWRLVIKDQDSIEHMDLRPHELVTQNHYNRQLAELSLLSFVKIIIEINTQPHILDYKLNEDLQDRIPDYSVRMGFGLHVGWAIEGAIGSSFKIDASYLSPNVNLAARLEAATNQFGVSVLFSGQLFDMFNNQRLIQCCRHIDTVTVKGSLQPLRLYTIDLYPENLLARPHNSRHDKKLSSLKLNIMETLQSKFGLTAKKIHTFEEHSKQLDEFHMLKLKSYEEEGLVAITLNNAEFRNVLGFPREPADSNFRTVFAFGVDSYLNGDWKLSRGFLDKAKAIKPDDGPSLVLYNFMKKAGFEAPKHWKRCRELVDK